MEPFTVSTNVDLADWRALVRAAQRRLWANLSPGRRLLRQLPLLFIALLLAAGMFWWHETDRVIAWVIAIVATLALIALHSLSVRGLMSPRAGGAQLGPCTFDFTAAGFTVLRPRMRGEIDWAQVLEIRQDRRHIYLWVDSLTGYVIPARDLPPPLTVVTAVERLKALKAGAPGAPGPGARLNEGPKIPASPLAQPFTPPAPPRRVGALSEIGAVVAQLAFLRVDGERYVGSDLAIALLGVALLAIWIPLDPLIYPSALVFDPLQISGLGFAIGGGVALAWLLSRASRPRIEYRRALLVVTGSFVLAIAGSTLVSLASDEYLALLWTCVFAAWGTFYYKQALHAITGGAQVRALLLGAAAAVVFITYMDVNFVSASVWAYADQEDSGDDSAAADEDDSPPQVWARMAEVQFGQERRIDEEVAKIAAHSGAGAQVYFLGFAGVGEQRVFADEIDLAASRIAARFGAGDRELRLVNDRRNLVKWPLASTPALRHALKSLGGVMDADDVLFLALSSHGSSDGSIVVSNIGTTPAEITVLDLADALRESGIRWKVIVISACYAGSFLDALEDDHTIVLTAAAKDRTSFGCSDDRGLTYFGEALYRDSMPHARSLREAFDGARASIAKREKAEGIEASNPQAFYGAAIERKLAGM